MDRRAPYILILLLVACTPGPVRAPTAAPTPLPSMPAPTPTAASGGTRSSAAPPTTNERLPRTPGGMRRALTTTYAAIYDDIERWIDDNARAPGPRRRIALRALYLQRIYRRLARDPSLARATTRLLSEGARTAVDANLAAARRLFSISGISERVPDFRFARPAPIHRLRRYYERAEHRFGVPWEVLAAVNFAESKFGRVLGPSSAGALGPMQFLPSTWEQYGAGGNILDPKASIMGAARYLRASGAARDLRGALFAYNPTAPYVEAILIYAREIRRDVRNLYVYYFWHVFVVTKKGDVRLTGPGRRA